MPPPSGQRVEFDVIIVFPWDPQRKLFAGERIYFFNVGLVGSQNTSSESLSLPISS
jgi:hypothetical protein